MPHLFIFAAGMPLAHSPRQKLISEHAPGINTGLVPGGRIQPGLRSAVSRYVPSERAFVLFDHTVWL
jgi:hypothetical protein